MTTYYDVTLKSSIPGGSDILNKSCTIVFTYSNGSYSDPSYSGTIFSWPTANSVRVASAFLNIESAWAGANNGNGGTLTINTSPPLVYGISAFAKVP